jgi:hypothetical protein
LSARIPSKGSPFALGLEFQDQTLHKGESGAEDNIRNLSLTLDNIPIIALFIIFIL